jgi:hypothetical protein
LCNGRDQSCRQAIEMKRQLVAFVVGLWGLAVAFAVGLAAGMDAYGGPHLPLFPLSSILVIFGGAYLAGFLVAPLWIRAEYWTSFWGAVLATSLGAVIANCGMLILGGAQAATTGEPPYDIFGIVLVGIIGACLGPIFLWPAILLSPVVALVWLFGAVLMHFVVHLMTRRYSLK